MFFLLRQTRRLMPLKKVLSKNGKAFSLPLIYTEVKESITSQEMLGVQFGILIFEENIKGTEIHVSTDGETGIPIVKKFSMVLKLNLLAISINEKWTSLLVTMIGYWILEKRTS